MVSVPPEIASLSVKVRYKHNFVRDLTPNFVTQALLEAEELNGCYYSYWRTQDKSFLYIYRLDRQPDCTEESNEVLPWVQLLFEDGQVHAERGPNYIACYQGNVYTTDTIADMVANTFTDTVDKTDSRADAFDFDNTELGRKLLSDAE